MRQGEANPVLKAQDLIFQLGQAGNDIATDTLDVPQQAPYQTTILASQPRQERYTSIDILNTSAPHPPLWGMLWKAWCSPSPAHYQ